MDNVFLRIARSRDRITFHLDLDPALPAVHLNEYVIWEVIEPIIQNSVEHAGGETVCVSIATHYDPASRAGVIRIADGGKGIESWLLEKDEQGIRKIFREQISTKTTSESENAGYGCYLAYEIARQRCGWVLDAENLAGGAINGDTPVTHPHRIRTLLIEDEEYDVRRVRNTLRQFEDIIEIGDLVSDGYSALEALRAHPDHFDVVIMDFQIAGGLMGEQLIREIKAIDSSVQVIVVTKMTVNVADVEFANRLPGNLPYMPHAHLDYPAPPRRIGRTQFCSLGGRVTAPIR